LKAVIDAIGSGTFSNGDNALFQPIVDSLLNDDQYLLLADYRSYVDCQERVSECYRDQESWTRKSILNVARMGKFSSDRSIREYAEKIWQLKGIDLSSHSVAAAKG
jgi:starch phosphorylase